MKNHLLWLLPLALLFLVPAASFEHAMTRLFSPDGNISSPAYLSLLAWFKPGLALFLALAASVGWWLPRVLRRHPDPVLEPTATGSSSSRVLFSLVCVSFLGLYLEILLIRWLGSEVYLFGFFNNLILLASFLGLGVGFGCWRKSTWHPVYSLVLLALAIFLVSGWSRLELNNFLRYPTASPGTTNQVGLWYMSYGTRTVTSLAFYYGTLLGFFFLTAAIFVPLGSYTGNLMGKLPPLRAYSWNIASNIVGILFYSLLTHLQTPPVAWFAVALLLLTLLSSYHRSLLALSLTLSLGALCLLATGLSPLVSWSPYYKIVVRPCPEENYSEIKVGNFGFQGAGDMTDPVQNELARHYHLPYFFSQPARVLVLGAGCGNDVATALLSPGIRQVDAVEIDPKILGFGRTLHPNRPYLDPRVRLFTDDARAFIRRAPPGQYDLVVFGFLDSHAAFSSVSSVRLDNFLYTTECFAEARRLLAPDGLLYLSFLTMTDWMQPRLVDMLTLAFGHPPLLFNQNDLVTGAPERLEALCRRLASVSPGTVPYTLTPRESVPAATLLCTDDWPYLYLGSRTIPLHYLYPLLLLFALSVLAVWRLAPQGIRFSPHFFFLGAGFLLLETRGVLSLGLQFGTTWTVNTVVLLATLAVILLANFFLEKRGTLSLRWAFPVLLGLLLLSYFVPPARQGPALAVVLYALPLLMAGLIFGSSLHRSGDIGTIFFSNLTGAILGGLSEYSSMAWGINALLLLAAAFYALAWLTAPRVR